MDLPQPSSDMETETMEVVTSSTLRHLHRLKTALNGYLQASPNERAMLLGQAFASQLTALEDTAQRIVARMPDRALRRTVRFEADAPQPVDLSDTDDSRALTTWLVSHLQREQAVYEHLLSHARLASGKAAATELAALFLAQSKRIALEAHRFQDL